MKRKILFTLAIVLLSLASASAQTTQATINEYLKSAESGDGAGENNLGNS